MPATVQRDAYANEESPLIIAIHTEPDDVYAADSADSHRHRRRRVSAVARGMFFFRVGALFGATAVALKAYGAHGLPHRISDPVKLDAWATATQFQLVHAVAMLAARGHPIASMLFTAGMTLFSGSIYALVWDAERFKWAGPVTPIGGTLLIIGWLTLAFSSGRVQL